MLVPGKRVPGDENRGILYTATGRFTAYYNYANRRYYAGTFDTLPLARAGRDAEYARRKGGAPAVSLKSKRELFDTFVTVTFFPLSFKTAKSGKPKKASTIRAAISRYRVYLQPFFGPLMLEDVTYSHILTFRADLERGAFVAPEFVELPPRTEGGRPRRYKPRRTVKPSPKTTREVLVLLRQILKEAARAKGLVNPFPDDFIPSGERPEIEPPDLATAVKIAKAIRSLPHRTLTYVLIYAGCRLGEALALEWRHIDFEAKRVRIEQSADAKTREIQTPKTKRGIRTVPLDPALAKELRAYRRALETAGEPSPWLFPTSAPHDGVFVLDQRSYVQRHFDPARRTVTSARVTPHMLRHTWCTLAVTRYPVAYVSKWAGHSDPSFTYRTYVQAIRSEEARLAATFTLGRTRRG